ncbi:hypothetical protein SPRG_14093 [Saprolegnia parasitica CBS 223.65]|uniref:Uncharacterized protein n=1 Tax=Saprolegnia parasitica (strain CBS 223.65) TaxID=695850 RepID=A0A067C230_SAPPC|nr:hypothetical protein SPRG_14093 [Saprolegnia parasitica CBS 223.65]KDO20862.1 hypothetical protein SPRG_14093 [Saprolegnia parasitica CBS 223.65]|eukprot:XP_012208440.1 hypothetical protein SPRG_14093 [Saprolegnia parasitica CBS 223.65]
MTDAESILAYLDRLLLSAYATPYLTCGQCNSLNFIDVAQIQGIRNDVRRSGEYERLVPCVGCGRTIFLRPGVASLAAEIEHKTLQDDSHEKKRAPAAIHIQRVARGYLGRMEAKARRQAKLEWERKIFCAAACIQRRIRGVEARTRYRIEQCIAVILNAHKSVYAFATTNQPNAPRIFWYESAAELAVFRTDYREFVRRTGNRPPLHRVEANVQEVARRVLARENRLVARIQAAWRGLTTRVAYLELKRQLGWHRSSRMAPAVRIQRLARMHADRRRRPAPVPSRDACLADYSTIYTEKTQRAHARHLQRTLLATYRDHVQHKRGAKLVGLPIEPFRVYKKGVATLFPHGNGHPQSNNTMVKTKTASAFLLAKAKLDRHHPASLPQRLRQQVTNQRSDPYD